jgi:hypothetical protein
VPLAPGKPVVQLSPRSAPLDENSVTDEINLTWAVPKVSELPQTGHISFYCFVAHKQSVFLHMNVRNLGC